MSVLKIIANDFNFAEFKGYDKHEAKIEYSGVEYKEIQSTSIIQIEEKQFSQKELNWCPQETFETGIRKTVEWYLNNLDWCRRVQDGSYQRERLGVNI